MKTKRIPETNCGIQGNVTVKMYNEFQRNMRDRGFIETDDILKNKINSGIALEVCPGPGYLGLEWLHKTSNTQLKAIDISKDMIDMARKNALEYKIDTSRAEYFLGNADSLPFENESFDSVFTNGALHEWEQPISVINEIYRVLKPGGRFFISDLKRDINFFIKMIMSLTTKPKEIRYGLHSSINAAYTKCELEKLLSKSDIKYFSIDQNPFGLKITGKKE